MTRDSTGTFLIPLFRRQSSEDEETKAAMRCTTCVSSGPRARTSGETVDGNIVGSGTAMTGSIFSPS